MKEQPNLARHFASSLDSMKRQMTDPPNMEMLTGMVATVMSLTYYCLYEQDRLNAKHSAEVN